MIGEEQYQIELVKADSNHGAIALNCTNLLLNKGTKSPYFNFRIDFKDIFMENHFLLL